MYSVKMTFRDARHIARMSVQDVAKYLDISLSTVKRYDKTGKAPKAVIECLRMIGGRFPDIALPRNGFEGWSFGQGYLWTPAGERFTSGDILASRINQELVNALLKSEIASRRRKKRFSSGESKIVRFPDRKRLRKDNIA